MNKSSLDSYTPTSLPSYDNHPTEPDQPEQYTDGIIEDLTTQRSDQEPERPIEPQEKPTEILEIPEEPLERSQNPTEGQTQFIERTDDITERREEPTEKPEEPAEKSEDPSESPKEFTERPDEPPEIPEEPMEIPEEPMEIPEEPMEIPEEPTENPEELTEKSPEIPEESQRFDLTEMPYTSRIPVHNTTTFKESNEYKTIIKNSYIPPRPVEEITSEPPFKQPMQSIPFRSQPNKTIINRKKEVFKESHVYIDSDFQQVTRKFYKITIICNLYDINTYNCIIFIDTTTPPFYSVPTIRVSTA